jgi:polysaccharide pyruvyl transferase WcaK-like protein
MKIAIAGWYHQNNAGDDRLLECIQTKLLSLGVENVEVFIAWNELKTRIEEINVCDFLLIGGGGLILRNTNNLIRSFEKITIPYGLFGVSVDSVGEDNTDFIAFLSKNSKFIVVRDGFSSDAFAKHNEKDVFVAPDLTFLYPYAVDNFKNKTNTIAVSLRPWNPNPFKQYTKNYHRFNKVSHKFPFINDLLGLWNPSAFIKKVQKLVTENLISFPLFLHPKQGDNLLLANTLDSNEASEFDINILKQSDFLIGMRLHAVIFATQMGIPFIALNYASKVRNYVEGLGMADYIVEIDNYSSIDMKISNLKANSDTISKQLISKTEQYTREVHTTFDLIFNTYIS